MTAERWTFNDNEEYWSNCDEYDSREEALAAAREDGYDYTYTGRIVPMTAERLVDDCSGIAEHVVEGLFENATVESEEHSGDWPDASAEDMADLAASLRVTILAWLERRGLEPTWCMVEDIERHDLTKEAE